MSTLAIVNNFQVDPAFTTKTGQQGPATNGFSVPYDITVSGFTKGSTEQIATAAIQTLYTAANDFPATFVYFFFVSDQIVYLQVIGSATHYVQKVAAYQPFVLPGYGSLLAAANTTPITGGAEPAVTAVTKIVLGNYSGSPCNYNYCVIL